MINFENSLYEFKRYIENEESTGLFPYFTSKNLRERLDDLILTTQAILKLQMIQHD